MKIYKFILCLSAVGYAQNVQPTTVQVSRINNITSSATVIDNRSTFSAQNNIYTFCAFGSGSWSATIQYSDTSATGPWSNFTDAAASVSNASTLSTCGSSAGAVGGGTGYHGFIRFNIVGTVSISYSGQKSLWIPFNLGVTRSSIAALWTGTGCGTPTNALLLNGNCGGGSGSGITSLNTLTAPSQVFGNDTNVIITSTGSTHQLGWQGYLGGARGGLNADASSFSGILKMTSGVASPASVADVYGLWPGGCVSGQGLAYGGTCFTSGTGTMTSLTLTVPSWLVNSTPTVTTSGTMAITPNGGQASHQVIGTCGSTTSFVPCLLLAADLPSLTTYLDTLCSTQGSVIFRGSSSWSCLGPGTSGYYLQTQGAGVNPLWQPASGGGGGALAGQRTASTSSDSFLTTDVGKEIDRTYTSGACTESLSSAATLGFTSPWASFIQNDCLGNLTITATTSVFILPAGTSSSSIVVPPGQGVSIWSDSTNYHVNGTWMAPISGITISNNQIAVDSTYVQTNANEQSGKTITLTETSSSTSVYTFSMSPTLTAYPADVSHLPLFTWHVAHACAGGATTGNISTLGAVAIVVPGGGNPVSANCPLGADLVLMYDSTTPSLVIVGGNASSGSSGLIVGTTTISSGANGKIEYNNSGVLGEYSISGTGNVAMTTSPVLTTPKVLGSSTGGATVTSGLSGSSSYTYTIPSTGANDNFCLQTAANCTAAGYYSSFKGSASQSIGSGSDVTMWTFSGVPALATGACFAFEGTLEASVAATYKIFVDSTLISTPVLSSNGVGGYYIIWKSLYCNTTAQSNQTLTYPAQILYIALSSYSLGGVPSIGQFYGEAPQTTPTAIDWSTSHTITVKVNSSSSGTAVGSMFWIHN